MPIGAFIDGLRLPWGQALAAARRIGLAGIQFTLAGPLAPARLDSAARRTLRTGAADHGLAIASLCGDLGGHAFADPAEHAWRLDETRRILDLAADLGCGVVSAHIGVIPAAGAHPRRRILAGALATVGREAAGRGVRYAIETGPETSTVLRSFLDGIGERGLAVNFDPANLAMVQGEDAVAAWRNLASWTAQVHAKDGVRLQACDAEEVYGAFAEGGFAALEARTGALFAERPLGAGQVGWPRLVAAMAASGYQGWLTIERETGPDPEADIAAARAFLTTLARSRP